MLHKALTDAVRWSHLPRNPVALAEPPKADRPEMKVWSPQQLRAFVDCTKNDRLACAWLLFVTTGMRRGEVLGLCVGQRRFQRTPHSLVVRSLNGRRLPRCSLHATQDGQGAAFCRTRPCNDGRLSLPPSARQARRSLDDGARHGPTPASSSPAKTEPTIHPQRLTSWFEQFARTAELPRIRLHDLRHSYATAALAAGIPAKVDIRATRPCIRDDHARHVLAHPPVHARGRGGHVRAVSPLVV